MQPPTVRLTHYDPRWRQEFQQTRSSLLQSCRGRVTEVEHVGSTSIPGLIARPIIDCLVGLPGEDGFDYAATSIEGLNFRRIAAPEWAAGAIGLVKPRHGEPTHWVLLTRIDSEAWRAAIAIREYLLMHPEDAVRFEEAKVKRWRSGAGDPLRYEQDKSVFFSHLLDQIDARRRSQDESADA